jgi:hypothetical protein
MARRSFIRRAAGVALHRLYYALRTARETVRYRGFGLLLWEAFQASVGRFWEIEAEIWFSKDLEQVSGERRCRVDLQIAEADESEVPAIVACELEEDFESTEPDEFAEETRTRPLIYLSNIRRGERCFVARVGAEIVHVNWTHYVTVPSLFAPLIILEPTEVLTTGAYTPPQWRGMGIHAVVLNHMLTVARNRGRKVAYTMTLMWNRPSRKAIISLGWRRCGIMLYVRSVHTGKARSLWIGADEGPFASVRSPNARRLWRRFYRLRNGRCIVLAGFRTVRR